MVSWGPKLRWRARAPFTSRLLRIDVTMLPGTLFRMRACGVMIWSFEPTTCNTPPPHRQKLRKSTLPLLAFILGFLHGVLPRTCLNKILLLSAGLRLEMWCSPLAFTVSRALDRVFERSSLPVVPSGIMSFCLVEPQSFL